MEGDYYDYEKNLAQSFESEQNAKYSEPRKRQRLDSTNSVELKGSPSSTKTPATSAPAKGTHQRIRLREKVDEKTLRGFKTATRQTYIQFLSYPRRSIGVSRQFLFRSTGQHKSKSNISSSPLQSRKHHGRVSSISR